MPMAGKGMLLTSMDIDASDEADFNLWYDREHLAERVAIEGFLEARRYIAHGASPKYLCLYSTSTIDVLDSPAYKLRLANPTEWTRRIVPSFRRVSRSICRVAYSEGVGQWRPYAAQLDHANEAAHPGYYAVTLGNGIRVEITVADRAGIARKLRRGDGS